METGLELAEGIPDLRFAIVLILGAYFIGSNILNNYFQFGSDDPLKATCTGIFMMIINMGVVAGAVKGWEAILRRVFS